MQYLEIYFKNMEEMVDFVRRANTVEADVDLQFGHILVDAKSIQGVLAMGCGCHAKAVVHSQEPEDLDGRSWPMPAPMQA